MKKIAIENLLGVVLVLAATAAYLSSLGGVVLFDDYTAIFRNANVTGDSAVFSGHRWLVDLSFYWNMRLGGKDPVTYHIFNLLIHLGCVLFIFGAVRRTLLGSSAFSGKSVKDKALTASLCGAGAALLWGVHPLTSQSVTYICQRYESMMAFFMFGAFYAFIRGTEGRHERIWFNLALLMLLGGMGCKEVMVAAPVLLLVYDYVFCGRELHVIVRKRGLFHIASFAAILVLMMYQVQLAADQIAGLNPGSRIGALRWWEYLYAQGEVILHYFRLALWPVRQCFDYDWRPGEFNLRGIFYVAINAFILGGGIYGVVRRKGWGFAVFMFYAVLAPTSSVVPVADLAAEHRMYVPLVPVTGILVYLLNMLSVRLSTRFKMRPAYPFVFAVIVIASVLGVMTHSRNLVYSSEVSMWRDVVTQRPGNLRARNDLAAALSEAGDLEGALIEYHEVISRVPEPLRGKLERGEAMVTGWFTKSSPEYAYFVASANLGTMYCNESRDYVKSFEWYLAALRVAPFNPDVRRSAINVLRAFGHPEADLEQVLNAAITESIRERREE